MIRGIIYILVGLILGTLINTAMAKYESGSNDAASVVGYGLNSGVLVPILVDADGVVQVN